MTSKRLRTTITVLICTALFAAGAASAQGRGPDARRLHEQGQQIVQGEAADTDVRVARQADMNFWLRQMPGRYRFTGEAKTLEGVGPLCLEDNVCYSKGKTAGLADCALIGEGPGVHCAIGASWPRFLPAKAFPGEPGELTWHGPYLDVAMMLFGIDPDRQGIRLLLVDGQSRAINALGFVQGDSVTFRLNCTPEAAASNCPVLRIRMRSDSAGVDMEYAAYGGAAGSSAPPISAFRFILRSEPDSLSAHE